MNYLIMINFELKTFKHALRLLRLVNIQAHIQDLIEELLQHVANQNFLSKKVKGRILFY